MGRAVGRNGYDGRHQSGNHHKINEMSWDGDARGQTVYVRRGETLSRSAASAYEARMQQAHGIREGGAYFRNDRREREK